VDADVLTLFPTLLSSPNGKGGEEKENQMLFHHQLDPQRQRQLKEKGGGATCFVMCSSRRA